MGINYTLLANDMKQLIREGRDADAVMREQFEAGVFKPEDFRIRRVAEETMGRGWVDACEPDLDRSVALIRESDGVDSTAFSNITGQIIFSRILESFDRPEFVGTSLIPTQPTRLSGEKLPGVSSLGDQAAIVKEGMPFPNVGFGEDFINTPEIDKRGMIVPVTKEAIFFDRTNKVLAEAAKVGESLGLNKEKRILDVILGEASTFATGGKWKWKGTEYAVYNPTTVDWSSYFYINQITDVLSDYTDLDAAMEKYGEMQDPNTREPITVAPTLTLLVGPALYPTARNIVNATELRVTTGSSVQTLFKNPFGSSVNVVESRYLHRRLIDNAGQSAANSRLFWFLGDFSEAFAWMENWPITPSQAPPNAEAEFDRDIVAQFKASMRGTPAVLKPHYVLRSTGQG